MLMIGEENICSYFTDTIWYSVLGVGEVASRLCFSKVVKIRQQAAKSNVMGYEKCWIEYLTTSLSGF
jgi:hypothetical protein